MVIETNSPEETCQAGMRLGEKAAENLLALMKNRSFDATCEFEAGIVERDSVKRLL